MITTKKQMFSPCLGIRKTLDHDLENELKSKNYGSGNFLDLGTGPGTQALQLSKFNFKVTGTDISQSAIEKAKKLSIKGLILW